VNGVKTHNIFELLGSAEENLRRLMQRTVEAYPLEWIVVHEALQNARDAIQKSTVERGTISIKMELSEQKVTVVDNGRGFPPDITLLGIGGTDKDRDDWKIQGHQGVGLKAVLLSTDLFIVESVVDKSKWVVTCNNAYRYVKEPVTLVEQPIVSVEAPNGTTVIYRFPWKCVSEFVKMIYEYSKQVSDNIAENNLDKMLIAIEWYFRSYSYAGDVNRLQGFGDIKPIKIVVDIQSGDSVPSEFEGELRDIFVASKNLHVEFDNKHWDIQYAVNLIPAGRPKPSIVDYDIPNGGKFPAFNENIIWTKTFTNKDGYKTLLQNSSLKEQPDVEYYESFFGRILGITVYIGSLLKVKELLIENPRHFVAADGIPSSHFIRDPTKGGELTYNRNVHCIINVNARLNYGKQNITDTRLLHIISEFYTDAYRATLKNISKSIVGTEVVDAGAGGYAERDKDIDIDILTRDPIPLDFLSLKREPKDENAVIALFYELIGRGYLEGYNTYSLHGKSRYNGRIIIKHSGMKELPEPQTDQDLAVVEFKQKTSLLIDDFENDRKNSREIHLLVVWENDFSDNPGYQVVDIKYTPDDDRRFPRVKHCLKDKMTGWHIQMLILKDVINDIAKEIETENA